MKRSRSERGAEVKGAVRAPWWVDVAHPRPLGAALLLFVNDHALKGSGVLPGAVTGKLSDVAGLFAAPIVAAAWLRWAAGRLGRPLERGPVLAWGAALMTGAVFAAVKLSASVNAWVSSAIGPNSMDATDLLALSAVVPAALWMRRRVELFAAPRPSLRGVAAAAAGLACAATSAPKQPPPPMPAVSPHGRHVPCAEVTPVTCRHDATRFVVRLSARKVEEGTCSARVGQVYVGVEGQWARGPVMESPVVELPMEGAALVGAWGRFNEPPKDWGQARVVVHLHGRDGGGLMENGARVDVPCREGFGEDTAPPSQVAQ